MRFIAWPSSIARTLVAEATQQLQVFANGKEARIQSDRKEAASAYRNLGAIAGLSDLKSARDAYAPAQSDRIDELIPRCSPVRSVKPGILGCGDINGLRGKSGSLQNIGCRIEHDFDYVRDWSLWLDIRIIFMNLSSQGIRHHHLRG